RLLARDLGAGVLAPEFETITEAASGGSAAAPADADSAGPAQPQLVIVAAPPDVAGEVVTAALLRWPDAVVTDVSSVKQAVLAQVSAAGAPVARYVGSHPMAGRERSGAIGAQADLFEGRPWVVVPHDASDAEAIDLVELVARLTGAVATRMDAAAHDATVAAISHVPQVAASLVAARLRNLPIDSMGLAGQGVRDVTRIAASDPSLWTQILAGNAPAVLSVLDDLALDLDRIRQALSSIQGPGSPQDRAAPVSQPGPRAILAGLVADGNAGHARIPGKHGSAPTTYAIVTVSIPDRPGELGRLFLEVGEEGINLEDIHLEHGLGAQIGILELSVMPAAADPLRAGLRARGWQLLD
ncbi:MAG: prephenate dehydrogenase, partial [Micrococcales bacterium]|nr:prephenate dehydrogenase [Micrococcales bacterium]